MGSSSPGFGVYIKKYLKPSPRSNVVEGLGVDQHLNTLGFFFPKNGGKLPFWRSMHFFLLKMIIFGGVKWGGYPPFWGNTHLGPGLSKNTWSWNFGVQSWVVSIPSKVLSLTLCCGWKKHHVLASHKKKRSYTPVNVSWGLPLLRYLTNIFHDSTKFNVVKWGLANPPKTKVHKVGLGCKMRELTKFPPEKKKLSYILLYMSHLTKRLQ